MSKLVIRFKKRDIPKYIIITELLIVCFYGFFTTVLGFPSVIKYSMDVLNIFLLLDIVIKYSNKRNIPLRTKFIGLIVFFFMLFSILFWIPNRGDVILLLWGFRNTFRFLIFFLACIIILDKNDYEFIYGKINNLLIINLFLCIYEFVVLGYSGDYVGGSFGINQGCNASLNILIVIATSYNAVLYMQKKIKLNKLVFYIGACSLIAGLSELKIYVVEVVSILLLIGFFSKGFAKKILISFTGVVFTIVCIRLIENLIPGWEGFFTIENMFEMVTSTNGYTNTGDLNRFNAIPQLNKIFFKDSINLFGFGLGNCEFSDSFNFLNSSFSYRYGYLHYGWFSVAKIYLELGWLGVVQSLGIWIYTFYVALKNKSKWKELSATMAILACLFFFYNSTMNIDAAYLVYLVLASAYITENQWLNRSDTKNLEKT